MMKFSSVHPAILTLAAAFTALAQSKPKPLQVQAPDPAIARAIAQISPEQVRADIATLVAFHNRSTLSSMDTDLPPNTGVNAAADWLFAEFTRISHDCNDCLDVRRDTYIEPAVNTPLSRITRDTRLQNIYAVLKGTDPAQAARRTLVTGHYDSRNSDNFNTHDLAPGANDDASGVAVSLEAARVLSKLRFPSTIVFLAVAGEEQGLNGSRHLARLAKAENWDLQEVLNNDIVGGDTTPGNFSPRQAQDKSAVRVFSEGVPATATLDQLHSLQAYGYESDSPSRQLARAIAEVARTYLKPSKTAPAFHPVLQFRRDRFGRGGDHTSFNLEGFAAVRFTEWQENFNHQHQTPRTEEGQLLDGTRGPVEFGDFLKFVDPAYVANVARLNAAALATFASAPGQPTDVHIPGGSTDNFSIITWKAPAGAPANTTYEVLWRPTEASTWTMTQNVGNVLTVIMPISKDSFIFGVRSVDPAGHRSPAVVPMPLGRQTMSPSTPTRPTQ